MSSPRARIKACLFDVSFDLLHLLVAALVLDDR